MSETFKHVGYKPLAGKIITKVFESEVGDKKLPAGWVDSPAKINLNKSADEKKKVAAKPKAVKSDDHGE